MAITCPQNHAKIIQSHILTGLTHWNIPEMDNDIHKPFITSNQKLRGLVKYKEDPSIADPNVRAACAVAFVAIEYEAEGVFHSATAAPMFTPRNNRQAGHVVYIECNKMLKKKPFDGFPANVVQEYRTYSEA